MQNFALISNATLYYIHMFGPQNGPLPNQKKKHESREIRIIHVYTERVESEEGGLHLYMKCNVRTRTFWHRHKRRLKSSRASAQSDQILCCAHEETLHPRLSKMSPVRILIRLHECAGWSEFLLGSHVPMKIRICLANSAHAQNSECQWPTKMRARGTYCQFLIVSTFTMCYWT